MNLTWTGTDVYFLNSIKHVSKRKYPYLFCLRIFTRIADFFVQKHVVVTKHLVSELNQFGLKKPIEVMNNPVLYDNKFNKIKHEGFNILYYRGIRGDQNFGDWLYGKDIAYELKKWCEFNIIEVNGKEDMSTIYPIIDFYIRPNRHDGCPRMVRECEINDIPYYHSYENPNYNEMIKKIWKIYTK